MDANWIIYGYLFFITAGATWILISHLKQNKANTSKDLKKQLNLMYL